MPPPLLDLALQLVRRETGKAQVVEATAKRDRCCSSLFTGTKRMLGRLADCFCIGHVVLAALEVGLDVARRHQPDLVAERDQFPRPMGPSRARLDTDQARSEPG